MADDEIREIRPDKEDNDEYEKVCYVCRRPESKAGRMIKIQGSICICNDCMQKTFDSMSNLGFDLNTMMSQGMPNIPANNEKNQGSPEVPSGEEKGEGNGETNPGQNQGGMSFQGFPNITPALPRREGAGEPNFN